MCLFTQHVHVNTHTLASMEPKQKKQKNPRLVTLLQSPHETAVDSVPPLRTYPEVKGVPFDVTQSLPIIQYYRPQHETTRDSSSTLRSHPEITEVHNAVPDVTQSLPIMKHDRPQIKTTQQAVDSLSLLRRSHPEITEVHNEVLDVTQSLPIMKCGEPPLLC